MKTEKFDIQTIRTFLDNPDSPDLPEKEKKILKPLEYAYDMLKVAPPHAVMERLKKKFGISDSTAKKDITATEELFSPSLRISGEWLERFIIYDSLKLISVCKRKMDLKHWQLATATLTKIYLNKIAKDVQIKPEMLGNNQFFTVINVGDKVMKVDMNQLNKMPVGQRVDLTNDLFKDITEIEAELIMNS